MSQELRKHNSPGKVKAGAKLVGRRDSARESGLSRHRLLSLPVVKQQLNQVAGECDGRIWRSPVAAGLLGFRHQHGSIDFGKPSSVRCSWRGVIQSP